MVTVTSFDRSGLRDWLIQRLTAVVMAVYVIFLGLFMLLHPHMDYQTWHNLFAHIGMRVFTLLFILGLVLHTWIGLWIVFTDYVKHYPVRLLLQFLVMLSLLGLLFWCVEILWGL